jgi:Immunoglobulin domain
MRCNFSDVPQIICTDREVGVDLGEMSRIVCQVKANPPPEVTWFFIDKNETIDNVTKDASRFRSSFQV